MHVSAYTSDDRLLWDRFVDQAKNGTFLFRRDYMEYHVDRFADCSLMVRDAAGDLIAVMPASINGDVVASHGGLTFGGIITDKRMKAATMLDVMGAIITKLAEHGAARLVYKAIPHIYHRYPAEEDLYALVRAGARLIRRDISTTIAMAARLPFSKGRKYAIKVAAKNGVEVRQVDDYAAFMAIEEALLDAKYATRPTHSAAELQLLASRFPDNIRLFGAFDAGTMIAGVVIYEYDQVAHAQYIAASEHGKQIGASDLVMDHLIGHHYRDKRFFDFGISTERQGTFLNEGLIDNKQGFGGRATVHDFYELDLGG